MERKFGNVKINVEFEESKNRQQIASGDNINILFGKIKKWFTNLNPIAFSGKYSDLVDIPSYHQNNPEYIKLQLMKLVMYLLLCQ